MPVTHANKAFPAVRQITVELEDGSIFQVKGAYVKNVTMDVDWPFREDPVDPLNFSHYKSFTRGDPWLKMRMDLEGPADVTWQPEEPRQISEATRLLEP